MKYTIGFTDRAIETAEAIKSQLLNRWGLTIAEDFDRRATQIVQLIELSPEMFPVSRFYNSLRQAPVHKNCSMFYAIRVNKVIIHFFWDNRQDPLFIK